MKHLIRTKNFYLMMLLDSCLILGSILLAYLLRFEGYIPAHEWQHFFSAAPFILLLKLTSFWSFGLYKGMYRYISLVDLLNVLKATLAATAIIMTVILFLYRFEGFPRSVFIIDGILTFVFIGGLRVGIRLFLSEQEKGFSLLRQMFQLHWGKTAGNSEKGLVIIGAGDSGEKMLREIRDNANLHYDVIGFLDDDPLKHGMKIHGVPVLGPIQKIQELASGGGIDEILIALPSASTKQMKRIIETCEQTGLKTRTTPSIGELIGGRISHKNIREVSFEDLLGRDVVDLDMKSIGNFLRGEVILVSGAAGSIGSELCRQIASFNPKNLILLDKTENSLFTVEMEFRQRFPKTFITPVLGNVKHKNFLDRLFSVYRPQVVFHAAAYKHVPIVEMNPWEAVFNNIVGTKNIVEASHQFEADRFIMISTDKAVRPSSVMGATKRVSEMITTSYASSNPTKFACVRFGNVIGSEGSVVHLFRKQIERLGPVTVTHPEITRYFMTISEACRLILQAGAMGKGGEIFVLDMGTPIKITKMARDLIRLSGFKPDEDIEIKFIGLRPGEKLHEELITEGEGMVQTNYEKIFVLKGNGNNSLALNGKIDQLVHLAHEQDAPAIKSKLKEIVPDYQPFDLKPSPHPRNH